MTPVPVPPAPDGPSPERIVGIRELPTGDLPDFEDTFNELRRDIAGAYRISPEKFGEQTPSVAIYPLHKGHTP